MISRSIRLKSQRAIGGGRIRKEYSRRAPSAGISKSFLQQPGNHKQRRLIEKNHSLDSILAGHRAVSNTKTGFQPAEWQVPAKKRIFVGKPVDRIYEIIFPLALGCA